MSFRNAIWYGICYLVICFCAWRGGTLSTMPSVSMVSYGPSSFRIQYTVDSAFKSTDDYGRISLKTEDDSIGYDGHEIDLKASPQLINEVRPGDKIMVTIEIVDPEKGTK